MSFFLHLALPPRHLHSCNLISRSLSRWTWRLPNMQSTVDIIVVDVAAAAAAAAIVVLFALSCSGLHSASRGCSRTRSDS